MKLLFALVNGVAMVGIVLAIGEGYKIIPENTPLATAIVFTLMWIFVPRPLQLLWVASTPTPWTKELWYLIFGFILFPRATWGYALFKYFPVPDVVGWAVMIIGFFLDAAEDRLVLEHR